jgi:hypothetical protein
MSNPNVVSASELKSLYFSDFSARVQNEVREIAVILSNFLRRKNVKNINEVTVAYYRDYAPGGQPLYSAPDSTSPIVELNLGLYNPKNDDTEEFRAAVSGQFDLMMNELTGYTITPFDAWSKILETSLSPQGGVQINIVWKRVVVRRISWNNG